MNESERDMRADEVPEDSALERMRAAKREELIAEISARLRAVCAHLSDAEFRQLVLDMAEMRLRFAALEANAFRAWPEAAPDLNQSEGGT